MTKKKSILISIGMAILVFLAYVAWKKYSPTKNKNLANVNQISLEGHEAEKLTLIIKEKHLKSINLLKNKALKENSFSQAKKYFKGNLINNQDTVYVKFKMKGDLPDHYDTDRFSLRVVSKEGQEKWGTASIQHPKVRGYLNEWVLHKILKHNDIAHLKYEFKTILINEKVKGTYAVEQYFSDPKTFENWKGEPGPILGFRDNLFWTTAPAKDRDKNYDTARYREAEIKTFNAKNSNISAETFSLSHRLLSAFQQDSLPADSVFDMQKMGKFYALMDLMGAKHALRWINVRYYFNPTSKLFEPLGFDSNSGKLNDLMIDENYINKALHGSILRSDTFIKYYYEHLNEIKEVSYLEEFFKLHDEELNYNLKTIMLSDPNYNFKSSIFFSNQKTISDKLEEKNIR